MECWKAGGAEAHKKGYVAINNQKKCIQETYGVATIWRLLEIIGLFCRIYSLL